MTYTAFAEIILCKEKSQLEKLCKKSTISMEDFVGFIMACEAGVTHLNHIIHYFDYVPDELETKEEDWAILSASAEERASKEGQKSLRRVFKLHDKRQYRVGHMFFSKELVQPFSEWHFIFFEVKELNQRNNHWEKGAHIHITNHLWPNLACQDVWNEFLTQRKFPTAKLHLSCIDENRKKL